MTALKKYIALKQYKKVSFQGAKGAWSHQACQKLLPECTALPCLNFESALDAVEKGEADLGMIPIDNSLAGRVADVHALLPNTHLHIVGEYYLPIHHHLLAIKGAHLSDLKEVHSHVHALSQCRNILKQNGIQPIIALDTAGSAKEIAQLNDKSIGAIASKMAAEIYGLQSLKENIADGETNVTRFVVVAKEPLDTSLLTNTKILTSFLFTTRNIPASLYKALGGFATNGVNLTRLESYLHMVPAASFWIDAQGCPGEKNFDNAMEELAYFSLDIRIFGSYEYAPYKS